MSKKAFIEITVDTGATAARFYTEPEVLAVLNDQSALVAVLNSKGDVLDTIVRAEVVFAK